MPSIEEIILFAVIGGIVPSVIWLKFWLKEDNHQEPRKIISVTFMFGMISVFFAILIEKLISLIVPDYTFLSLLLWAATEENLKFLCAYIPALRTRFADEPIDMVVYMVTAALGFSAMENCLFLIGPFADGNIMKGIATIDSRFVGASLLHILTSATLGIFMAESFFSSKIKKWSYLISGLLLATILHAAFNNLIIKAQSGIMISFGLVWIGIIVVVLILNKIKSVKNINQI